MNNELYHHGILGQKWGVRRFQNKDGSLTNAGQKRYYAKDGKSVKYGVRGMRKIGASYDERVKRGEALRKNGSGTGHALLAHVGRNIVAGAALTPMHIAAQMIPNATGREIATRAINTAAWGYSMANIVRTYQDISDMHAYKGSKRKG